ncbi:alpha/beta hydrolase [Paenibacillus sp. JZ16]|uniref:alpha/beta hydrolase n=1 Tax=Paenibacillus sp. JZ16 TaxID=1906272 RepID=UPI00188A057F|nr:alpha/beta hydrolase [Paenibacillus sp. JZ16]
MILKIIKWMLSVFVLVIIGGLLLVNLTPVPFIHWLRSQPEAAPAAPSNWAELEQVVEVHKDLKYPSTFKSNEMDLYLPKDRAGKLPTILWVHGGAFVSGDKSGTAYWCTMMASKGYAVVSMNYEVAPEARYPAPVLQMTEVYQHLKELSDFPSLDLDRLIVGGDSAGAQIASQFIAIQTNADLAQRTGIEQAVPEESIQAALLYCGPYNVKQLASVTGRLEKFFLNQLGWAYIGTRNWKDGTEAEEASTTNHVTTDFPPTFITDGNTGSFEKHGKELEARLKEANVPVKSLFYPLSHGVVQHEYQFQLNTKEAMECFEMTLSFLEEQLQERG